MSNYGEFVIALPPNVRPNAPIRIKVPQYPDVGMFISCPSYIDCDTKYLRVVVPPQQGNLSPPAESPEAGQSQARTDITHEPEGLLQFPADEKPSSRIPIRAPGAADLKTCGNLCSPPDNEALNDKCVRVKIPPVGQSQTGGSDITHEHEVLLQLPAGAKPNSSIFIRVPGDADDKTCRSLCITCPPDIEALSDKRVLVKIPQVSRPEN